MTETEQNLRRDVEFLKRKYCELAHDKQVLAAQLAMLRVTCRNLEVRLQEATTSASLGSPHEPASEPSAPSIDSPSPPPGSPQEPGDPAPDAQAPRYVDQPSPYDPEAMQRLARVRKQLLAGANKHLFS